MREYLYEDQIQIEDTLRKLLEALYDEVGVLAASIKTFDNGDLEADFLVDGEGSVFHMEISNNGSRVTKQHLHIPDNSFASAGEEENHA